ncbi:MAG: MerR family DNA-binding transcriptional regulator [Hahellaceae bacterium]|nr:MerR family DNA-binding transcriptional regulator [Hahellaceae bacterium]MCP5170411.1 MerR family DNA-binding transcriptional regulator [Hahellaceae bacterium]
MTTHRNYSISDLAKEFDITTRTIRFYESEGLLAPERQGQTRIYTDHDRVALKLILRGKRLGLSLAESKELIFMYDPQTDNRKQLTALLTKIHERRKLLQQQLDDIKLMQHELDEAEQRCLDTLAQLKPDQ